MKNKIKIIACIALICFIVCQIGISQTKKKDIFIGTNLSHLLHNRAPAVDFIIGYALTDNLVLRASGGPIINTHRTSDVPVMELFQEKNIKIVQVKGWQGGLGMRYNMYVSVGHEYSLFTEMRGKHKNFQNTIIGDFQRKGYRQRMNYTADVAIWDVQVGFGQAWQATRFRMEFLVGLGWSDVNVKYGNIPAGAAFITNQIEENPDKLYWPGQPYEIFPTHFYTAEFTIGYLF